LIEGVLPGDPAYGVELPGSEGVLTTIDSSGLKKQDKITAPKSNYRAVFEDVYQTIRMYLGQVIITNYKTKFF